MKNTSFTISIPHSLPLLESLCWNIANPYQLDPKAMLDIYCSRWHYRNLAPSIKREKLNYIHQLIQNFQYVPLVLETR